MSTFSGNLFAAKIAELDNRLCFLQKAVEMAEAGISGELIYQATCNYLGQKIYSKLVNLTPGMVVSSIPDLTDFIKSANEEIRELRKAIEILGQEYDGDPLA